MKPVVAIFAHPDDEAFGPSGTLASFVKEGRDVYLLCVTNGDAGQNVTDNTEDLKTIRQAELRNAAEKLGIKQVIFLDFRDGYLSNALYHEVADALKKHLDDIKPEILVTLEPRGISGHLDHIAVSFITTYVFNHADYVSELWYFCLTKEMNKIIGKYLGEYFVYYPAGYTKEEISKTVSVSDVWETKIAAMKQHESQLPDVEVHLQAFAELPQEENYIIVNKHKE